MRAELSCMIFSVFQTVEVLLFSLFSDEKHLSKTKEEWVVSCWACIHCRVALGHARACPGEEWPCDWSGEQKLLRTSVLWLTMFWRKSTLIQQFPRETVSTGSPPFSIRGCFSPFPEPLCKAGFPCTQQPPIVVTIRISSTSLAIPFLLPWAGPRA